MPSPAFHENVVIITGASSGIGRELAYQLADQGAWLALAGRDSERLEAAARGCRQRGGRAIPLQTDVTDSAQCQALIERAATEYGRIDTLVNNAGITMWSLFEDLQDLSVLDKIMRVNYFGAVYCTHFALPYLKQTQGRIVVISSLTGKAGVPTRSGYAASKHAVVGFFDTLRIELAQYGISVTISYPDFVATEARERALGKDGLPIGKSPIHEDKIMTVETCARLLIKAMEQRKREDLQTARARFGPWLKLVAPQLVDRIAARAIRRGK